MRFFKLLASGVVNLSRFTVSYFGFIIFLCTVIALHSTWLWASEYYLIHQVILYCCFIVVYMGSVIFTIQRISHFNNFYQSASKLLYLYFEALLVFASIYIWAELFSKGSAIEGFHKIPAYLLNKESYIHKDFLVHAWRLIIDAIHFSITTSSTVGYGDMYPKHPVVKLIVDMQILFSIGISIFGFGKFFSIKTDV